MARSKRFYVAASVLALTAIAFGFTQPSHESTAEAKPKVLPSFQTTFATWQPESAAQVVSITTTTTRFLGGLVVLNTGASQLKAVQIGWSLEGHAQGKAETYLETFKTSYFPVAIDSGKVGVVRTSEWRTADVLQYALEKGFDRFTAQAGIVGAKFADGTTYTYDLAERKRFLATKDNPEVDRLLSLVGAETLNQLNKEIRRSLDLESESFPAAARVGGDPAFKPASFVVTSFGKPNPAQQPPAFCCKNSLTSKTICGANATGCTIIPCMACGTCPPPSCSSSCACQTCDIVPNC